MGFIRNQTQTSSPIMIIKDSVATYNDIATTYLSPLLGWTVVSLDTGNFWRYDGISAWINIGNITKAGLVVGSDQPSDTSLIWIDTSV